MAGNSEVIITGGRVDAKSRFDSGVYRGGNGIAGRTVTISADTAVEGDYVKAIGTNDRSGIAGRYITIRGGNIDASAFGGNGAGISVTGNASDAFVNISGGTITAKGVAGAGIGTEFRLDFKGTITISGGTVTAYSTNSGAGIGSGARSDLNGTITISGGTVNATGSDPGSAGIGAGFRGNAREGHIIIKGGTVTAKGASKAAGIGGGTEEGGTGGEGCGDVQILGGTVVAQSGEGRSSAIGHGHNDEYYGNITFADNMRVRAGWNQDETEASEPFPWDSRALACMYRWYAIVEPCEHPWPIVDNLPVFPADSILPRTHRRTSCKYCCTVFQQEEHDFDDDGVCMVCGFQEDGFCLSFNGNGAEGGMESIFVARGSLLLLPDCLYTPPEGRTFTGWKIGERTYQAKEPVRIDTNITAVAQWTAPFTITIDPGEGGGEPISMETSLGEKYPLPIWTECNFTEPEWYLFQGWAVNGDTANLKQPLEPVTIEGDTTVTAIWERPTRAVAFDLGGGIGDAPDQEVVNGEKATRPADPTREGYAFKGWYVDEDGEAFDFATPINGDVTLIAVWEAVFGTPDFTLPSDITLIEEYAFEGIDAHIVYIPDGCAEIEPYAFKDCRNLTRVRIPAGCAIGEFAFDGCEDLYIFGTPGGGAEQYCAYHDNCTFVAE